MLSGEYVRYFIQTFTVLRNEREVYTKTGKPKNDYESMTDYLNNRNKKSKQITKSGSNTKLKMSGRGSIEFKSTTTS